MFPLFLWYFQLLDLPLRRWNTRYKNPQLVAQHEQICCVTSCEFDEKRATKPKFVVDPHSTFHNNFLQPFFNFLDLIDCTYLYSPGPLWIPASLLNGLPWLNKVTYLLTRNKCFCCATSWLRKVKNMKHRPKTCNKIMLRDKLRAFVSRISLPLAGASCNCDILAQKSFSLVQKFISYSTSISNYWNFLKKFPKKLR